MYVYVSVYRKAMKKSDVKIGERYVVKVSGTEVPVLLVAESSHGGWIGRSEKTGREVRIKTAGRLRRPYQRPGMIEAVREMRSLGLSFREARDRYYADIRRDQEIFARHAIAVEEAGL